MDEQWPNLSGRLTDEGHVLPVRVYFEDTDSSGVVYHGSFVRFLERGRSELLRAAGISHMELAEGETNTAFAVRRLSLDFKRPARIDDVLEIVTKPVEMRGASITLDQLVRRNGEVLVEARVQVVLISPDGRPQRISGALRERLGAGH